MVTGVGDQISDPRAGHTQALHSGKSAVAGPMTSEEEKKELEYQHFAILNDSKPYINGCKHRQETTKHDVLLDGSI